MSTKARLAKLEKLTASLPAPGPDPNELMYDYHRMPIELLRALDDRCHPDEKHHGCWEPDPEGYRDMSYEQLLEKAAQWTCTVAEFNARPVNGMPSH
jgi:hypothetical protein